MEQIAQSRREQPAVSCIREVRVPVPYERREEIVRFYAELLGLPPWPEGDQIPGGWGVGHPQRGLYLQYRHDPKVEPLRRRFALAVPSLDELQQRLEEHQWPCLRYHGLDFASQWMLISDPVGHLIEVREAQKCL
jgi:hypothetical protein